MSLIPSTLCEITMFCSAGLSKTGSYFLLKRNNILKMSGIWERRLRDEITISGGNANKNAGRWTRFPAVSAVRNVSTLALVFLGMYESCS